MKIVDNSHFDLKVIETKRGEKNSRTGIAPVFFSFRVNNFGKLICSGGHQINTAQNPTNNTSKTENSNPCIVVCDECLKCYHVPSPSSSNDSQIDSQLNMGRPTRVHLDLEFIAQLVEFANSCQSTRPPHVSQTPPPADSSPSSSLDRLFNMNLSISTNQLCFVLLDNNNNNNNHNLNLIASLNAFSLLLAKRPNETISSDNHGWLTSNLVITDLVCTLDSALSLSDCSAVPKANFTSLHVVGPLSVRLAAEFSPAEREMFAFVDLGSFNLTLNRFTLDFLLDLQASLQARHFSQACFRNLAKIFYHIPEQFCN